MKRLREPAGRVRWATPDEIDKLISACAGKPYLEAFTIVALNTGMRRNEILSLSRASVDWTNSIANLEKTKNGTSRRVPLNHAALETLAGLPHHSTAAHYSRSSQTRSASSSNAPSAAPAYATFGCTTRAIRSPATRQ